jgi:branched-subunit amino acid aminotransferase/4-amino-4-deoxychorismate lyase
VLIWADGQIVPGESLAIAAADRTFEHGLGLFETLRTWDGAVPLLARHLQRLRRSATELGLPLDPSQLPGPTAISRLRQRNGIAHDVDVVVRITLSGGINEREGGRIWIRLAPLPAPPRASGANVIPAPWTLAADDPLARHKTLNYWSKRLAHDQATAAGADEVLFATADGRLWEGSRTNLFLIRGETLITPDLSGPVLPGIMRALVLECAAAAGIATEERSVSRADLAAAAEVFLTNSVRGILPVERAFDQTYTVPGAGTARLRDRVECWLRQERKQS